MAASLEYQVVSKIVERQDFHTVDRLKIAETFFFSPECRTIFKFLYDHFHARDTLGCVPSFQLIQQIFPGFPYTPSMDNLETLLDQLRLQKMRVELLEIAENITKYADYNPRQGLEAIREAAAELSSRHERTNDLLLSNAYDQLYEDYQMVATQKGVTGLPWPWQPLNEATQGIHKGSFYVVYGRPKNMKTWIALYIATILNMYANARVLVLSMEMSPKDIIRRVSSIRAVVNYKSLRGGTLPPADADRFFHGLRILQEEAKQAQDPHSPRTPAFLVTGGGGANGISFLQSKIREFRPNFVLVDGMYLMQDDRQKKRSIDWKAVAHISQDLKRTATEFDIPVMATAQANRKAEKDVKNSDVGEIAYSDAIGQDVDFSIRVQKRIDKATKEPEIVMGFPGSRETDLDSILIHAIPSLNFSLKSTIVVQDEDSGSSPKSGGGAKNGVDHQSPPRLPVSTYRGS